MPTAASHPTATLTGDTPVDDLRITPDQWFAERVRPLVAFATGGDWLPATLLPDEAELARVKQRLLRAEGAPARVALTWLAGWRAGYMASVIATGVVRDAVLVGAGRPGVLRVRRHSEGWLCDAELSDPCVAVVAGHPWAGRPGVETVADRAALERAAIAEIAAACGPMIELVARRSRRGRLGLWEAVRLTV